MRERRSEALFGDAPAVARAFLEPHSNAAHHGSLEQRIVAHTYCREKRRDYVEAATEHLKAKSPALDQIFDIVLVGAGMHAATFVYSARKATPSIKILVVERTPEICSTFYHLGDSLVLNSPTFSKVGLNANIVPGHFVQLSDFDELAEGPFPTAKHLHELATMVFFHADADILFDFDVVDLERAGEVYALTSCGRTIRTKSVVISNGMGDPRARDYQTDRTSQLSILGDAFIRRCYADKSFHRSLKDKRIAVIGAGDTANSVMEYLLPLVYPRASHSYQDEARNLPRSILWLGQPAETIQQYFFANKLRYCHSGGIIEYLWHGEAPFDLPADVWAKTKGLLKCIPDRLLSLEHRDGELILTTEHHCLTADLVIDCTGRANELSATLLQKGYDFVHGDIVFHGGRWCDRRERFVGSPYPVRGTRIACQLKGERIYVVGSACPLGELIDDDEAKNGAQEFQEDRTSLTNSKWSLEHTLPRTVAFAARMVAISAHE